MLVKVCGIANSEFIHRINEMRIYFTGFIFYPKSERYAAKKLSEEQIKSIPGHVKKVGVFVNENMESILRTIKRYQLDFVQLHGDENISFVKVISKKIPVIKAFRLDEEFDFEQLSDFENYCSYFLFDTKDKLYGGTGKKFNWEILQKYSGNTPFLLSGGISPGDAENIHKIHHPMCKGIDINSGFETEPGIKNIDQIKEFLNQII
ncbi:MAG: phosphoribosylanthranilate isomerase [Bacteroidetes bacterium]|nr:phosphoribosylanthranilate isomerase [Bacteroidota bacterium]